ncbi:MFS transporter [Streptomyces cylindrosporus]|uniref:MFS transporter n=1 Tax=Streptomyces cylindrosporus TaxID=2927583 RepID=A0ABS9YNZ5_9ACTN|nr:MFS transporter [Streptomyces cylindrosporus]MCI3278982.1 MFS transporter [Streptomyces cylindrosporus]
MGASTAPAASGRPPVGPLGLPGAYWWIWTSILVNWLGAFTGPILALSLTDARGYSVSYAGFVVSLLGAGAIAGSAAGGILADRIGRRRTMFAGHCLTAASMVLLGLGTDRATVSAAAFAVGLGAASVRPAAQASLADLVPSADRPRAFAYNYWAVNTGTAVSAVLAGLMVEHGYTLLFLADAATTLLCGAVVLAKVPETRPVLPRPADRARRETARAGSPVPLRKDAPFLLFVLLTLVFAAVYEQKAAALPVVVTGHGHSAATFSLLMALNALLVVLLQLPVTKLAAGRSRAAVLLAGGVLVGVGFGLTGLATGTPALVGTVVVWTAGEMLYAPLAGAVSAELAPVHRRGRYQGAYGTAWSAAAFIGPAGGTWVLDHAGAGALWSLCAAAGVGAGLGCALILRTARGGTPHPENFRTAPAVRSRRRDNGSRRPSRSLPGRDTIIERNSA